MRLGLAVVVAAFALQPLPGRAAEEVVAFGLTNRSIHATPLFLDPDYRELRVLSLSYWGYNGVSVRLGQADSGLFFSPYARARLEDTNFMVAHAYGRSAGLERRLVSVFCERAGWATYPVTVDFLPLGTVRKTVRIFVDQTFVGEETYTNGAVTVYTSNSDQIGPRVNPFWRMPDGSVGVLLEFNNYPPVSLPSGRQTYASRLFIRADDPLFPVDYVSRVDVYGGGGLTEFSAIDERLGMFGHAHRALGGAVFTAKNKRLTVAGCADAGADGVLMELPNSPAFAAQFQPVSLASNGALFQVSAAATYERYPSHRPWSYFGPLGLENANGEKRLRAEAPDANPWEARIEMLEGTNRIGQFITTNSGFIGSFGTNDLAIISSGVVGGVGDQPAALHLQFREPATLTSGPHVLRGDVVRLSPVSPTNDIGTFISFQVLACGVPPFTITNETMAAPPPFGLTIERSDTNVFVAWPASGLAYTYFEASDTLAPDAPWSYAPGVELPSTRSRNLMRFPFQPAGAGFFRLRNPYAQPLPPLAGD